MSRQRQLSAIDRLILQVDSALRALAPSTSTATRPSPASALPAEPLDAAAQRHAAGLMRVNHTGEVCAQALYSGQALTARLTQVRADMENAAREEQDHLVWCAQRLEELGSAPSVLNPFFYGLSFAAGAFAGLAGDKWSLGFVEETERQVVRHLENHLATLPAADARSRAVVARMRIDEAHHAEMARAAGSAPLPFPVRRLMHAMARVMTGTVYHL